MKVEPLQLKAFSEALQGKKAHRPAVFVGNGEKEKEPEVPTFDEADLKTAEREGYQKGFIEGISTGKGQAESEQHEVNKQLTHMSAQFTNAVMPLFEHYKSFTEKLAREIPHNVLQISQKVAGAALDENAHKRIEEITKEYCKILMHESQLNIVIQESLGDTLEESLQGLAQKMPETTEIVIIRDPDMPKSDCKITWKLGSAEHKIEDIWEKVTKAVTDHEDLSLREHSKDMDELKQTIDNANNTDHQEE